VRSARKKRANRGDAECAERASCKKNSAISASPRFASCLLLATTLLAASSAGAAPFRVYQYVLPGASMRGDCRPPRVASVAFADYARGRWVPPRGLRLLGADCTADAGELIGGRSGIVLAAIRLADDPPRQAILDLSPKAPPSIAGWPVPLARRLAGNGGLRPAPRGDPATLRLAAVCWPSVEGWPVPADRSGSDALASLEPKNPCEWWLLPFKGGEPEPDLDGRSYLVVPNSRDAMQGRFAARRHWPDLFGPDAAASVQDALEAGWDAAPTASDAALVASEGAMAARTREARPQPAPQPRGAGQGLPVCAADVARTHQIVFARFAAWAERFGVSEGREDVWLPSRWGGRCATYEVLRSALEERLGCRLEVEGCAREGAR